ncbi:hypothetical protein BGX29_008699, partial [Mortierella sp. GBA35]
LILSRITLNIPSDDAEHPTVAILFRVLVIASMGQIDINDAVTFLANLTAS